MHMLRHVVDYYTGEEEDFFQAIRNYVANPDFKFGNTLSEDFQSEVEAVAGADLSTFFTQWLYWIDRPDYEWGWSSRNQGGNNVIDLVINQTQSGNAYEMPIDMEVEFVGGETEIFKVLNTQKTQNFTLDLGSRVP